MLIKLAYQQNLTRRPSGGAAGAVSLDVASGLMKVGRGLARALSVPQVALLVCRWHGSRSCCTVAATSHPRIAVCKEGVHTLACMS